MSRAHPVILYDMLRKLITLTAVSLTSLAMAPVAAHADTNTTCPEFFVTSVSTGTMVAKAYTTATFCLTGGVDAQGRLTIAGETVDNRTNDTACAAAKVSYVASGKSQEVVFPLNCTGNRVAIPKSSVPGVSAASISLCMVDKFSGKALACAGTNQFYPAPKPVNTGKIIRR